MSERWGVLASPPRDVAALRRRWQRWRLRRWWAHVDAADHVAWARRLAGTAAPHNPLWHRCGYCGAQRGRRCVTKGGNKLSAQNSHASRY